MDRRKFLRDAGVLTVSAAALAASATATSAFEPGRPPINAVLFDRRYSACREFAGALAREGAKAFDVQPDVAVLWYGPLRDHLAARGGCVAGLTTFADFAVSQSFGRDYQLSLRHEGAHDGRGSNIVTHRLRAAEILDGIAAALRTADSEWAEALAAALMRSKSIASDGRWRRSIAQTSGAGEHPGFLQSWLLVPMVPRVPR